MLMLLLIMMAVIWRHSLPQAPDATETVKR
jgi:hypothetical protein